MATVPKSDRTTIITLASAIAGPFELTFRLFDDDALAVFVNDLPRTDFTISSNYVDGFDDNATITFDAALEISDVVRIHGDLTPSRGNDYFDGPQLTEALNIELGRLWSSVSEIKRDANRSAKFFQNVSPIALQSGRAILVNDDGDGLAMGPTSNEIANAQAAAAAAALAENNAALSAAAAATFDPALYLAKADNLSGLASTGTALENLGFSAYIQTLIDAVDAAAAQLILGVGTNGTLDQDDLQLLQSIWNTGTSTTEAYISPAKLAATITEQVPASPVKAWVNFNGTGTVSISASSNVDSITDHGTGDYSINFTDDFGDTLYAMSASGRLDASGSHGYSAIGYDRSASPKTVSSARINSATVTGASFDYEEVDVIFVR